MQYAPPVLAAQPANGRNCGIDWARDDHAITIVDSDSRAGRRRVCRQLLYRRNADAAEKLGLIHPAAAGTDKVDFDALAGGVIAAAAI